MKKRLLAVCMPLSVLWITALSGCINDPFAHKEIAPKTTSPEISAEQAASTAKLRALEATYGQFKEGYYGLPVPVSVVADANNYGLVIDILYPNAYRRSTVWQTRMWKTVVYDSPLFQPDHIPLILVWTELPELFTIDYYRRRGSMVDKDRKRVIDCKVPKSQEEADLIPKDLREAIIYTVLDPNWLKPLPLSADPEEAKAHYAIKRQFDEWLPDRQELMPDYVSYLADHFYEIVRGRGLLWLERIVIDYIKASELLEERRHSRQEGQEATMAFKRRLEAESRQRELNERFREMERRQREIEDWQRGLESEMREREMESLTPWRFR